MRTLVTWALLLLPAGCAWGQAEMTNPGFDNELEGWDRRISEGMGEVRVVDDGAGGRCAQLHKTVATEEWSSVGIVQQVQVEPNSVYEVSLRYRTVLKERVVGWACRMFVAGEGLDEHRSMVRSEEWRPFEWRFGTGPATVGVSLSILLTYSSGDLWVDDVRLRKVGGSVEAEDFGEKTSAEPVSDEGLSGEQGLRMGVDGAVGTKLRMEEGAWRIQVFGRGESEEGLARRAIEVRLGEQRQTVDLHEHGTRLHGRNGIFQVGRSGELDLSIARAAGYEGELIVDRAAWIAHNGPGRVKRLHLDTPVVAGGEPRAVIVAAADPAMQQIAAELQRAILERSGASLAIVDDETWMAGDHEAQNAITIGNMLQNKLTERLYCLWYTYEDCWYPGEGGWVVRSVHDPWGTGKNVIVLAGSDAQGTREAARQLVQLLGEGGELSIGHTIKVQMAPEVAQGVDGAVGQPDPEYAMSSLERRSQRSLMSSAARAGTSYVCSGDARRARMLVIYLLEHKRRPELGHDTHMELWKTIRAWDNVEECPEISEEERLEITNYLLAVLRSEEGVFNGMFVSSLGYSSVRHNHHMLAAMDAYYGGHYFKKYYQLPEADDWLEKARFCFASQELQDKGQDESGNYEGSTALRPLLPYAYTEPGYQLLPSDTARRFMDRCCVAIDNRYSSSGHGDCWDVNCFPTLALGICAWYYRDEGYQYILEERRRARPRESDQMQIQPPFRMEGVVKPTRPARFEGVTIAPLNQEHYNFYRGKLDLRWNLPWERSFDKISFRTRFAPDEQYLLLDGYAGGSHGHRDANCLIRFTDNDRVWLVDDSYTEGPFLDDHNGVLATRGGIADTLPACARLYAAVDFEEVGITRTTLPDHSGTDWERNVIWLKERCFVVLDRMRAVQPGDYGFRCMWRTLGRAELEGNKLITRQDKETPERQDLMCIANGGDVRVAMTEASEAFAGRWARYEHAEPVVNLHSQDAARKLEAGEELSFANLLYTSNAEETRDYELAKISDRVAVISGDETMVAGIADGGLELGGLSLDAGAFLLRESSLTAVGASRLNIDGLAVWRDEGQRAIFLDLVDRKLITETELPVRAAEVGPAGKAQVRSEVGIEHVRRASFAAELEQAAQEAEAKQAAREQEAAEESTANVSALWECDAGAEVRAMIVDGNEVALGADDGSGILLGADGRELWRVRAEDRVNAVSAGDLDGDGQNELIFASEDTQVYAVDRSGKELWTFKCPPYPERGGKRGQARDVLASDLDGDGRAEVIVGANNMRLHILSPDGTERRSFTGSDPHMTFSNFAALDLRGDGSKTVLAFPSTGSFGHGMEFTLSGRAERFSTDGWPSHIRDKAAVDLNADGKTDLACGTNRGNVYYRIQADGGLSNEKVFSTGCAIGAMAGLSRGDQPGLVAVGIEMSYIHVLDGAAERVWSSPTSGPVTALVFTGSAERPVLVAGTRDGGVLFFDLNGDLAGRYVTGCRVNALAALGEGVAAACADGSVRSLHVVR